jgi:hypothetical protein
VLLSVERPPAAAPLRHVEETAPRCCRVGDEAFDAPQASRQLS